MRARVCSARHGDATHHNTTRLPVAAQLDAGNVWVNCNQALWAQTPFGGWKASGFGFEYGEAGLHEYLRHKTVTSARQPGYSWKAYHG